MRSSAREYGFGEDKRSAGANDHLHEPPPQRRRDASWGIKCKLGH
jgi:hypothetical protein